MPGREGLQQALSLQWVLPVLEGVCHQLGACALHTCESSLAGLGHWDLTSAYYRWSLLEETVRCDPSSLPFPVSWE